MAEQAVDPDGVRVSDASAPGRFLGRTRELKELRADIERAGLDTLSGRKAPRARVLLIAGRPGSGRTSLAGELVRQVAHRYPDGVLRARLGEPDGTPVPVDRAAADLLTVLGLPTPPGAAADDLTAALREALTERRVLLLLDDAADAEQVDALLPDSPDCLVVAVARGPLTGISDVRPCTLGGLDTKSAVELLSRHTGSVRITVDPRAAEGLVEACQAQPAALMLAGGWLAARPPGGRRRPHQAAARRGRRRDRPQPRLPAGLLRAARLRRPGAAAALPRPGRPRRPAHRLRARRLLGQRRPAHPGRLRRPRPAAPRRAPLPEYEVPGCLHPLLRAVTEAEDRPAELRLARARMLERTVRLLQSCRAITETDSAQAREKLAGTPRALRFATPGRPPTGCACAARRCSPRPGSRSPTGSWTRWPGG
ncbi:hypothetical protein GCM10020295_65780 [Streptomyces cinereospinus]